LSPQARKSSSRRRSSQKKDEEPQVDRQGSKTDDDSQQGDQTTETASSSPPVEKTKPEDGDEQPTEQSTLSPYQPSHPTLQNAGLDQQAAEEARQAELQAERDEHNRRTGDVSR
jgi:hypothetical protein